MAYILHSLATGIHPGAYVQPTQPANPYTAGDGLSHDLQDGVLWVDTSSGAPPYPVRVWQASTNSWTYLQLDATGYQLPHGHRLEVVSP
jgi:hypothetical protein